jgi:DedD protein
MESPLKQRLIGAAVLAALAIIFLPMLLKGPAVREPDATEVPLSMPAAPGDAFETRELPLTAPEASPSADGVLGMRSGAAAPAADAPAPAGETPDETAIAAGADAPAEPAAAAPVAAPAAPAAASVPAPVPAPGEPPVSAGADARTAAGAHVLTVGTYTNAASANALAARLRAAGLPVLSERVTIAAGAATRLRVGPFASRSAAEAVRQRVEQVSGTPSRALVLDAPVPREAAASAPVAKPAATPVQKPSATTPAPVAQAEASGFAVQLSAPSVEADANALRDRARAAGFTAYVQRADTEDGVRFRVRIGPVADRAEATALLADAKAKLGLAGFVVTSP